MWENTITPLDAEVKVLKDKTNEMEKFARYSTKIWNSMMKTYLIWNYISGKSKTKSLNWRNRFCTWKLILGEKMLKFLAYQKNWAPQMVVTESTMVHSFQQKTPKKIIYNFLEEHLKIDQPHNKIDFQRVHHLGKPNKGARPPPIIARLLGYGDNNWWWMKLGYILRALTSIFKTISPSHCMTHRKDNWRNFREQEKKATPPLSAKLVQTNSFSIVNNVTPGETV